MYGWITTFFGVTGPSRPDLNPEFSEIPGDSILCPALKRTLPDHPDIAVEMVVDYGLADVVAERFYAGVRLGEQVGKDMIAVRIAPDIPTAIVRSPEYFRQHRPPGDRRSL